MRQRCPNGISGATMCQVSRLPLFLLPPHQRRTLANVQLLAVRVRIASFWMLVDIYKLKHAWTACEIDARKSVMAS